MAISATSETLRLARQRVAIREGITPWRGQPAEEEEVQRPPVAAATPRRAWVDGPSRGAVRAAEIAFAVTTSWVAAGAFVIGVVWAASTVSPRPPTATPAETLPYALAWSAASLTMLASSVGSTFATVRRRRLVLLGIAGATGLILLALVLVGYALG
ncbi:MAG TPA: hypothetical protein VE401_03145 [Solirubrobacterales bacterium]|nr:hypothetical protein [Solirubrobacterales bacterium]